MALPAAAAADSARGVCLQVHLRNDCQFEELPCERADCKERVLRKDLRDHVEKACKYREATCSHCKSQVPMITLQVRYSRLPIPRSTALSDYSGRNREKDGRQ